MPRTVHRGPRFVHAEPLPRKRGSRVLMPEVLARTCWLVRQGIGATQEQVAEHIQLPPASVSKLELGVVTMAAHHLDAFAGAYSALDRDLRGDRAEPWRGWELLRVATVIADRLGERRYAILWQRPDLVEREALYTRGKWLVALMKECWPDEIRRRP